MAKVKGIWTFKDVLKTVLPVAQDVKFTSAKNSYVGFFIDSGAFSPTSCSLCYKFLDETLDDGFGGMSVYFYDECYGTVGWDTYIEEAKTIDFGKDGQDVSPEFYAWLLENTIPIEINITENGTTTLATAGKYCDRNIDVNVNVPSYEAELAEQKAITDSILDRSITNYFNDTVTEIGIYAFMATSIERAEFTQKIFIRNVAFRYCSYFAKLILRSESVCTLEKVTAFADTPIENGTGYIYVPDNLVNTYKTATNWSNFADKIKPISELEE